MIPIHDCFDIAISHGHNAMDHLYVAVLQENKNANHTQQANEGDLVSIGHLHFGKKQLFKELASTVVLFQAMMEALINYSLDEFAQLSQVGKKRSFADKWTNALNAVSAETTQFDDYLNNIYRPVRNGLIHPSQSKLTGLQTMTLPVVHAGLKSGWLAYAELFQGVGRPHDNNSWKILCNGHQVPPEL